jgi:WD40 repeat protein
MACYDTSICKEASSFLGATRRLFLIALIVTFFTMACTVVSNRVLPTINPTIAPTNTLIATPTNPPTTNTSKTLPCKSPKAVPAPKGLIYSTHNGLWRVEVDGNSKRLLDQRAVQLSPDGTQVLLLNSKGGYFLADLPTGIKYDLEQVIGRHVCCIRWSSEPNKIYFGSWPPGKNMAYNSGFLSEARANGTEYRILDEKHYSHGRLDVSPDGQAIAYDDGMLDKIGSGAEDFEPIVHGLPNTLNVTLVNPAWSPDGKQLAWAVTSSMNKEPYLGVAVFNLENGTARLMHFYKGQVFEGVPSPPIWSPDGQWLLFQSDADEADKAGFWATKVNGDQVEEHKLGGYATDIVWSPDGRKLIFRDTETWMVDVGTWNKQEMTRPCDWSDLLGWETLP